MNLLLPFSASADRSSIIGIVDKELARFRCYAMMFVSDLVALIVAFAIGTLVCRAVSVAPVSFRHAVAILTVITPLYLLQACLAGAYTAAAIERLRNSLGRSMRALAIAASAIMFIGYFLKASGDLSRGVFASGLFGSFILVASGRIFLRERMMRMLNGTAEMVVVIDDGTIYDRQGPEIVLTPEMLDFHLGKSDPHQYHLLSENISRADRVIVACPQERAAQWASVLKSLNIEGEIFTDMDDSIGAIGLREYGQRLTLLVTTGPLDLPSRVLKRCLDLTVSVAGIVLLSPLLIGAAIAIKLDSPGPIFFRQERIGRANRIFRIWKFRTMYVDQCDARAMQLTLRSDSRVTKIGKFLRQTSIDELPQLFNIVLNEMSVVGPRPHALAAKAADTLYWDVDERYRHRHVIKPGLTGLAQVRGHRGNTEKLTDLTDRLQADLEYVVNWSLQRDLFIMLKTVLVVFHQNAY